MRQAGHAVDDDGDDDVDGCDELGRPLFLLFFVVLNCHSRRVSDIVLSSWRGDETWSGKREGGRERGGMEGGCIIVEVADRLCERHTFRTSLASAAAAAPRGSCSC